MKREKWNTLGKTYKWAIIFGLLQAALFIVNKGLGLQAVKITGSNLGQMMLLIPPIFMIMGLIDVWIPKEVLMRYLGKGSGWKGLGIVFLLGTIAAGPIYVAFPMGMLLLQKGAKLSNIIFFLGVWSSTKLPIILFEIASLGMKFTLLHVFISLPLYLLIAYFIEKTTGEEVLERILAAEKK